MTTFTCAACNGTFLKVRPDAEANAEAEQLWGVADASTKPAQMAIICDVCFQAMIQEFPLYGS